MTSEYVTIARGREDGTEPLMAVICASCSVDLQVVQCERCGDTLALSPCPIDDCGQLVYVDGDLDKRPLCAACGLREGFVLREPENHKH